MCLLGLQLSSPGVFRWPHNCCWSAFESISRTTSERGQAWQDGTSHCCSTWPLSDVWGAVRSGGRNKCYWQGEFKAQKWLWTYWSSKVVVVWWKIMVVTSWGQSHFMCELGAKCWCVEVASVYGWLSATADQLLVTVELYKYSWCLYSCVFVTSWGWYLGTETCKSFLRLLYAYCLHLWMNIIEL